MVKITTESYIKDVSERYPHYDFSKTIYTGKDNFITVTCNKHKETFIKRASGVKRGFGCPKCGLELLRKHTVKPYTHFIKLARKRHGSRYQYLKSTYKGMKQPIGIICKKHGKFTQSVTNHVAGAGCMKCRLENTSKIKRSNTDTFIKKAVSIHGNRYDYSKVIYKLNTNNVTIRCSVHGEFEQTPAVHLRRGNCPKCSIKNRITNSYTLTSNFIQKAIKIHGDKYDYSKVLSKGYSNLVIIGCPIHGDFKQTIHTHLSGSGCQKCKHDLHIQTVKDFLDKSLVIHKGKYNYNKVKYINSYTKVIIKCPIHGFFEQTPYNHLAGQGCKTCGILDNKYTTKSFITKAIEKYGNVYDYSKVNYINSVTKVIIKCKLHGEYKQRPASHLMGNECPICNNSKGEQKIYMWLTKYTISFRKEYIIPDSKTTYRYDYYLPNLKILIEYDGLQHYKSVDLFGGVEALLKTKVRDKAKNKLAKEFGFTLIRIPYTNYKDLETVLYNSISKLYKYRINNKFYKNMLELCSDLGLDKNTSVKDVRKYLFKI